MPFDTVALEFVPPPLDGGVRAAREEMVLVRERARASGIEGVIRHLLIPGMIEEEGDRPVPLTPRLEPLDAWRAVAGAVPEMAALCTQVTSFLAPEALAERCGALRAAGVEGVIFVGVPRTMHDGEGPGVAPTDALAQFGDALSNRGCILIPTRAGEAERFSFKCERGATFALTQLLYSDAVVDFARAFAARSEVRPELLLSFGFVPQVERRVGLIEWLIQDPGNARVLEEQALVARLAGMKLKEKQRALLDLYKRCIDGVAGLGFPLSIHLEAPYGYSEAAFDTFALMLDYWSPAQFPARV